MKKSAILILLAVSIFLVSISTTLAWFANISYIDNDNLTASAITGYFRSGDGTADDPFVISTPRHLYNLAWLQYLGELNKVDKNGKITQYYFKLEDLDDGSRDNVIDVDGLVLPPIGTTENPFVGHFDGNGVCIKNLTVSNYLSTSSGDFGIVERPLSETTINETTTSIIGFFGVVGAVSEDMQKKLIQEDENADFRSRVNSVHDLFLENLTVRTETDKSLIGLLAGYVNGSVGNVGIGKSSIVLGENVRPLTDSAVVKITSLISSYSLIGECNDANVFWIDVPKKTWGDSDDPDSGVGWGGSINMQELRKRIAYIVGAVGLTTEDNKNYYINAFDYSGYFNAYDKNTVAASFRDSTRLSASFLQGTVMPITVDPKMFESPTTATHRKSANSTATITLDTSQYYLDNKDANVEKVLSTNSAYIVGGGSRTSGESVAGMNSYINLRMDYVAGYAMRNVVSSVGIFKSITTSVSQSVLFPNNEANLQMLTITPEGTTYVIKDSYNENASTWLATSGIQFKSWSELGFEKYEQNNGDQDTGVRQAFMNASKQLQYLQGIQFNSKIDYKNIVVGGEDRVTTANDIMIGGTEKDGYELINGAINFTLCEAGIVTAIAGTYTAYNTNPTNVNGPMHTMFRVLKVDRDSQTHTITNCYLINTIHKVVDPNNKNQFIEYVYNLTDVDSAKAKTGYDYKLVYDISEMLMLDEVGAAYYFEIPLNAGDYAIGSITDDSGTYGASLLYLDIGANGDQSIKDTTGTEATHSINGLTFVNMNNLEQIIVDGKDINSTNGYKVTVFEIDMPTAKDHGGLTMTYERTTDKVMTHTETDPSNAFTVQWTESDPVATQSLQLGQVILVNPKRREDSA